MKHIPNKEYEKYQQYLSDKINSRILTPEALRFICEANHYDAAASACIFLNYCRLFAPGGELKPMMLQMLQAVSIGSAQRQKQN